MMFRRVLLSFLSLVLISAAGAVLAQDSGQSSKVNKKGMLMDIRSHGREQMEETLNSAGLLGFDLSTPTPAASTVPQIQYRGGNAQVNNPAFDNIQVFPLFRPFIEYTQSETSVSVFAQNIVAGYNSSANQPLVQISPGVLQFTQRLFSGYSVSNDGGRTWTSGFIPPTPGSIFTFGDPALDVDRTGNFYYAGLGANAAGQTVIQVNKSSDGGRTWSDGVIVQQDNGGDKEWIAVGRDPVVGDRDNVYVTWTSFQSSGAQLRFGRSFDGGMTWDTQTIFAPGPDPNPNNPQNSLQFSNPYVDPITGRLYVPFLHFSNADQDFIRILISDDAGDSFYLATFNVPGAPDPAALPVVQPGNLIDCGGSGGFRLSIRAGANIGGRFGLPSYVAASRLVLQPALAARNGIVYLAWSNSDSPIFGDPNSGSNVFFMRSDDGGATWTAPLQVNPAVAGDSQHVLPSLALSSSSTSVHVAYYTQHADGTVDVDLSNSQDRGASFPVERTTRVTSMATALAPTNVRLSPPSGGTYNTTNYDRTVRPCFNLGEYLSVRAATGSVHVLWGDGRNSVTHPVNSLDPLSGQTHPQQDVFYQKVKAQ